MKASAVNNRGQVAGNASALTTEAFLWTQGATSGVPENTQMRALRNFSGNPAPWMGGCEAFASTITESGRLGEWHRRTRRQLGLVSTRCMGH
jgi:hypothetical protein